MIYLIEGSNKVGKTTFIKNQKDKLDSNCIIINNRYVMNFMKDIKHDSFISSLSMLDFIEELSNTNIDVYIDRFHLSEYTYGKLIRGYENEEMFSYIDSKLSKMSNINLVLIISSYKHIECKEEVKKLESIQNEFAKSFDKSKIKLKSSKIFF